MKICINILLWSYVVLPFCLSAKNKGSDSNLKQNYCLFYYDNNDTLRNKNCENVNFDIEFCKLYTVTRRRIASFPKGVIYTETLRPTIIIRLERMKIRLSLFPLHYIIEKIDLVLDKYKNVIEENQLSIFLIEIVKTVEKFLENSTALNDEKTSQDESTKPLVIEKNSTNKILNYESVLTVEENIKNEGIYINLEELAEGIVRELEILKNKHISIKYLKFPIIFLVTDMTGNLPDNVVGSLPDIIYQEIFEKTSTVLDKYKSDSWERKINSIASATAQNIENILHNSPVPMRNTTEDGFMLQIFGKKEKAQKPVPVTPIEMSLDGDVEKELDKLEIMLITNIISKYLNVTKTSHINDIYFYLQNSFVTLIADLITPIDERINVSTVQIDKIKLLENSNPFSIHNLKLYALFVKLSKNNYVPLFLLRTFNLTISKFHKHDHIYKMKKRLNHFVRKMYQRPHKLVYDNMILNKLRTMLTNLLNTIQHSKQLIKKSSFFMTKKIVKYILQIIFYDLPEIQIICMQHSILHILLEANFGCQTINNITNELIVQKILTSVKENLKNGIYLPEPLHIDFVYFVQIEFILFEKKLFYELEDKVITNGTIDMLLVKNHVNDLVNIIVNTVRKPLYEHFWINNILHYINNSTIIESILNLENNIANAVFWYFWKNNILHSIGNSIVDNILNLENIIANTVLWHFLKQLSDNEHVINLLYENNHQLNNVCII